MDPLLAHQLEIYHENRRNPHPLEIEEPVYYCPTHEVCFPDQHITARSDRLMQQHTGYVPSADDRERLKLDAKELLKRPVPDINWDLPPTTNVSSKKAKTAVTELPQPTPSSEETASSINKTSVKVKEKGQSRARVSDGGTKKRATTKRSKVVLDKVVSDLVDNASDAGSIVTTVPSESAVATVPNTNKSQRMVTKAPRSGASSSGSVKGTESTAATKKRNKPEKPAKRAKLEKPETSENPEKSEKSVNSENSEKPQRIVKPEGRKQQSGPTLEELAAPERWCSRHRKYLPQSEFHPEHRQCNRCVEYWQKTKRTR
ncbi:hypothetical protein FPQ18DRAFT_104070 [Pyronema domesticum]|uniref:Uncharacterized protein n=1 Tax=Pyronema omphalodes (strain CBS 100304) TaxID=1076935 RepID=U4LDM9_PYROM|nr:hypothetical protein FPQ18DRAFT_104070 [Pyronema domesticum]CCX30214.1 Protein of unknown function [Pyronema omphalodes CBS 100304]